MKKIVMNNLDETIIFENINGLDCYFYSVDKTKNFYVSLTVKYGGLVQKYKINNKTLEIIPGSAHFLEHKIMNYTSKKDAYDLINNLGSLANAYTDYFCTNYNIFGSERIIDNIKLILDLVFYPNITDKNVESEKGIISEEIDMNEDDPNIKLYNTIFNNIFYNSYMKTPILGSKNDIKQLDSKKLMNIYNDFYSKSNMFLVITGNYNIENVRKFLISYMKKIKSINKDIKVLKNKDKDKILINYEEIKSSTSIPNVLVGIKNKLTNFKNVKKEDLKSYLLILLSAYFESSGLVEKYKSKEIVIDLYYEVLIVDNYLLILIKASTKNEEIFINTLKKDIKNITINTNQFEIKKRMLLSNLIMSFENIEDVDYFINRQILFNNKINSDIYNSKKNLNYKTIKVIEKHIDFENICIVKQSKN